MFGLRKLLDRAARNTGSAAVAAAEPAVSRANEAFVDIKERLDYELPIWLERAGAVLRAVLLVLSTTTAVAAGFIAGIGLELIALVDKWSIVGMVVFYAVVTLALLSPFFIIPHTFRAWERRERRERARQNARDLRRLGRDLAEKEQALEAAAHKAARHQDKLADRNIAIKTIEKRLGEISAEREKLQREIAASPDRRGFLARINKSTDPHKSRKERQRDLDKEESNLGAKLAELGKSVEGLAQEESKLRTEVEETRGRIEITVAKRAEIERKIEPKPLVKHLLLCAYATYVAIAFVALLNIFDGVWALGTALLTAALCVTIWRYRDLALLGPALNAYFVIIGYGLGVATFGYETNVTMEVKGEPHLVRIVLATTNGYVVIKGPCIGRVGVGRFASPLATCNDKDRRELAFLPKEAVGMVIVARREGLLAELRATQPFKWVTSLSNAAWGAVAATAPSP